MSIFDQATPVEKTIKISFFITIFLHLIAVIFSEGHHKLDEYGGIFAYTGYGLGLWDESFLNPGEYPAQIRPWIQPLLYMIPISPYTLLGGENPFVINTMMRLISSIFGLFGIWSLIKIQDYFLDTSFQKKISILVLTLFWFFPYFHARSTAENFGISLFLIALHFILNRKSFLYAGLFLAVCFFMRFQMVTMIGPLILWLFIFKRDGVHQIILGGLFGSALMIAIDSYFYSGFSFTPWNYWKFNIIDGVASSIGEDPWHFYFKKIFLKGIPPLSIIMFASIFWYWIKKPKSLITWLMIPFFVVHCFIAHKELRFLYPLAMFFPLIFAVWIERIPKRDTILKIAITVNFILLPIASLKPAFSAIGLYHFIWDNQIREVQVLGDFPKPLTLYLRDQTITLRKVSKETSFQGWVFSNKFHFFKTLQTKERCTNKYLSYPEWLLNLMPEKNRKRSKVFSLFYCNN
jgi:phosphatidylinositol glycan class B